MKKITNFIRLDFMSIKPYITFKNLFIFILISVVTSYGNESHTPAIALIITFTMLYATYPFAVGDQNGIDSLYTILGISKKDVITGRYGFLLVMSVIGIILGIIVYLTLSLFFKTSIDVSEAIFGSISSIMLLSLNQFILYPIFFKNGYIKSKSFTFLPLIVFALLTVISVQFFKGKSISLLNKIVTFITDNPVLTSLGLLIIWIVLLLISYGISYKHYIKREF